MTAGAILVPSIIPLRTPVVGQVKNVIDTDIAIDMRSGGAWIARVGCFIVKVVVVVEEMLLFIIFFVVFYVCTRSILIY